MESGAVELSVGRLRMGDIARDGTRVHVNPVCRTSRASPGVGMECAYPGVLAPRDLSPAERLSHRTTLPPNDVADAPRWKGAESYGGPHSSACRSHDGLSDCLTRSQVLRRKRME